MIHLAVPVPLYLLEALAEVARAAVAYDERLTAPQRWASLHGQALHEAIVDLQKLADWSEKVDAVVDPFYIDQMPGDDEDPVVTIGLPILEALDELAKLAVGFDDAQPDRDWRLSLHEGQLLHEAIGELLPFAGWEQTVEEAIYRVKHPQRVPWTPAELAPALWVDAADSSTWTETRSAGPTVVGAEPLVQVGTDDYGPTSVYRLENIGAWDRALTVDQIRQISELVDEMCDAPIEETRAAVADLVAGWPPGGSHDEG